MKVFGIGLNKTGTRSLHAAFEALGLRSLHWGGPPVRHTVEQALADGRGLVDDLPGYDAYCDIWCLSEHFDLLDRQYPGSRYVLTTRPLAAWLDSRRRHVERNRAERAAGRYSGDFLDVDLEGWTRQYEVHHGRVAAHFAGRSDLLVLRVTEGEGYERLCPFLARPVRAEPFPALS